MSEENDLELASMLKAQGEKALIAIDDGAKEEWEKEYGWNCYEGDAEDAPFYESTISSGVIKCSDGEIPFKIQNDVAFPLAKILL